jgi:hypothetical protein
VIMKKIASNPGNFDHHVGAVGMMWGASPNEACLGLR